MFIVTLLAMILIYLNQSKYKLLETYTSPTNEYILELYKELEFKPFFSLSSEQGFTEVYVMLKDNKGKVLLEPHWYASCYFHIGDLRVDWDGNRVYFTKFNYIDLTMMSFDCH